MLETYVTCKEIIELLHVKRNRAREIMNQLRAKYLEEGTILPRYNAIPMSWVEAEFGVKKPKMKRDQSVSRPKEKDA